MCIYTHCIYQQFYDLSPLKLCQNASINICVLLSPPIAAYYHFNIQIKTFKLYSSSVHNLIELIKWLPYSAKYLREKTFVVVTIYSLSAMFSHKLSSEQCNICTGDSNNCKTFSTKLFCDLTMKVLFLKYFVLAVVAILRYYLESQAILFKENEQLATSML